MFASKMSPSMNFASRLTPAFSAFSRASRTSEGSSSIPVPRVPNFFAAVMTIRPSPEPRS